MRRVFAWPILTLYSLLAAYWLLRVPWVRVYELGVLPLYTDWIWAPIRTEFVRPDFPLIAMHELATALIGVAVYALCMSIARLSRRTQ